MTERRNKNRSYQQLRVWQDAIRYYQKTCEVFNAFPFELKRVASQAIASSDSIHRNIAEGHCRKSIREYIHFLYIALASLGESVSGLHAYLASGQITAEQFEALDSLAFKMENGLIKLVQSLQEKQQNNDWIEQMTVKEINNYYGE